MSLKWLDIPGTNYKISDTGEVCNKLTNKVLKKTINGMGYYTVSLCTNGISKKYSIHVLVAQAFIPNPENKPLVHHKDDNKLNPNADNLEWATYSENMQAAMLSGVNNQGRKVNQYKDGVFVTMHVSIAAAAKSIGLKSPSNGGASLIKACCDGLQKTSKGFTFSYVGGDCY